VGDGVGLGLVAWPLVGMFGIGIPLLLLSATGPWHPQQIPVEVSAAMNVAGLLLTTVVAHAG
jgi:hypothetical protein